jgi:hypothetical protein
MSLEEDSTAECCLMFNGVIPGGIAYQEGVLHQQGCCSAPHQFGGLCKE